MRNARAFFCLFPLPAVCLFSVLFLFFLRLTFYLTSSLRRLFSFFGHPSESLWSSFGHPIMSLLCPFKEILSSLPPFSLTVFQFSIFNFQLSIHFSFFNFQFSTSPPSPRPTVVAFFFRSFSFLFWFFFVLFKEGVKKVKLPKPS